MLTTILALYVSGMLSMKMDGTGGQPAVQHMGSLPSLTFCSMGYMTMCKLLLPLLDCGSDLDNGFLGICR